MRFIPKRKFNKRTNKINIVNNETLMAKQFI